MDKKKMTAALESIPYEHISELVSILVMPTEKNREGYPILTEDAYSSFKMMIPHLFKAGQNLLVALSACELRVQGSKLASKEKENIEAACRVLRNVTYTAGISAATDLWLLRQVLSTYQDLKLLEQLAAKKPIQVTAFAAARQLDPHRLRTDLAFLHSRGYLKREGDSFWCQRDHSVEIFLKVSVLDEQLRRNAVPMFTSFLAGKAPDQSGLVQGFLTFSRQGESRGWIAGLRDCEVAFRIVPVVLAMRALDLTDRLTAGAKLEAHVSAPCPELSKLFVDAGFADEQERITELGARVLDRGPGPYGIIYAYYPFMRQHSDVLRKNQVSAHVARGENVAASQDANRKTFKFANDSLDRYCGKEKFDYSVFIEHAVGQGEATVQRFARSKGREIQYFGADLEDAAIDRAEAAKAQGLLPPNMIFIRNADIGDPRILINAVENGGFSCRGAVMLVGNGFHEIRDQTNERMISVFKEYCDAGILLIFTEESALSDEDLMATGWNTYHAGFRYVHEISGQGLRPAFDCDRSQSRYSWRKCATDAGYDVLEEFTTRTRKIYPHPKENGYNPAISVSYFCVPGVETS